MSKFLNCILSKTKDTSLSVVAFYFECGDRRDIISRFDIIALLVLGGILGEGRGRGAKHPRKIAWLLDAKTLASLGRATSEKERVRRRR